jgi:septin family protein
LHYPSLLQLGEVEETIGTANFTHTSYNKVRQLVLDTLAEAPDLHNEMLQHNAQRQGLQKELKALYASSIRSGEKDANEQHALLLWRLLSTEHALMGMVVECREAEAEMADNMTEESYARLVTLKKQIGELQQETARLQSALEE